MQETTERGATAVALALVRARTGFAAVERSRKGTGCDWFVGDDGTGPPFQHKKRLEVSGVLHETDAEMARRIAQKVAQLQRGRSALGGYAVVVGFEEPVARMAEVP